MIEENTAATIVSNGDIVYKAVWPFHRATAIGKDGVCGCVVCDDNGLECVGLW